jgi:D-beta-D-heptose 7-phosphate kinase/D-beta-D-heptose 1-phosphate adenosyltransferase
VLAVCLAEGGDLFAACEAANAAAGIKVGRPGTATVGRDEIQAALHPQGPRPLRDKIVTLGAARAAVERQRRLGRTIGFTNGCFDILHHGHVALLEAAARECDVLVVGLNSDDSVRRLKGSARPFVPEFQRAMVLAALGSVDYVVSFDDDTPARLVEALEPDMLIKGGDYTPDRIVGADAVVARGGRVISGLFIDGVSTSGLAGRIRARESDSRRAA